MNDAIIPPERKRYSQKVECSRKDHNLNIVNKIFHKPELLPLIDSLAELNDFVGLEAIKANEYVSLEPKYQLSPLQ